MLGNGRKFGSAELLPLSESSALTVCQKVRPKFGRTFWQREGTEVSDKDKSSAEPNFRPFPNNFYKKNLILKKKNFLLQIFASTGSKD